MSYSKKETKKYILDEFSRKKIKYEIYDFESGASMIHVWIKNKFYAIQLEIESVGLSLVDDENPGFDTIPDERFFKFEPFEKRFNEILV